MRGIGPADPWLARDLVRAAARNPATTWCLTVTDEHGHPIGRGRARPAPPSTSAKRAKPGSRSTLSTGHRAGTGPGGYPPGFPGSGT